MIALQAPQESVSEIRLYVLVGLQVGYVRGSGNSRIFNLSQDFGCQEQVGEFRHLPQILEAMTLKICSEVVLPSESLSKINGCLHAFK